MTPGDYWKLSTNMSPTEIKEMMEKYSIAPKKLFGQNFLISEGILDKIVKSANLSKEDIVLEVGPGLGALTFKLAPLAKQIIAVEKDRNLVKILTERLVEEKNENVEIVEQDILKFNSATICHSRTGGNPDQESNLDPHFHGDDRDSKVCEYKLIANIPYYLTSALIRKFLESENKPSKIILMIQKEVAQRICAPKYDEKMSLLALSVQFYADAKILFYVSKENFWPAPKIDSAVIEITPKEKLPDVDEKIFFKIIRAGFSSKRKQLASNLSQFVIASDPKERGNPNSPKERIEELLKQINLNPKTRAEELKLEDWVRLVNEIKNTFTDSSQNTKSSDQPDS